MLTTVPYPLPRTWLLLMFIMPTIARLVLQLPLQAES